MRYDTFWGLSYLTLWLSIVLAGFGLFASIAIITQNDEIVPFYYMFVTSLGMIGIILSQLTNYWYVKNNFIEQK